MAHVLQGVARLEGLARRIISTWALVGGFILIAVVLVNSYSILAGALLNAPFAGDFELTELGVAVAIFCFLPYCQLTGANVSADIFTMGAGPRLLAMLALLAAVVATLFAIILIWRMSAGLQDYREYAEFTAVLQISIWWAFVPILVSLLLLAIAALISLREAISDFAKQRTEHHG